MSRLILISLCFVHQCGCLISGKIYLHLECTISQQTLKKLNIYRNSILMVYNISNLPGEKHRKEKVQSKPEGG